MVIGLLKRSPHLQLNQPLIQHLAWIKSSSVLTLSFHRFQLGCVWGVCVRPRGVHTHTVWATSGDSPQTVYWEEWSDTAQSGWGSASSSKRGWDVSGSLRRDELSLQTKWLHVVFIFSSQPKRLKSIDLLIPELKNKPLWKHLPFSFEPKQHRHFLISPDATEGAKQPIQYFKWKHTNLINILERSIETSRQNVWCLQVHSGTN